MVILSSGTPISEEAGEARATSTRIPSMLHFGASNTCFIPDHPALTQVILQLKMVSTGPIGTPTAHTPTWVPTVGLEMWGGCPSILIRAFLVPVTETAFFNGISGNNEDLLSSVKSNFSCRSGA